MEGCNKCKYSGRPMYEDPCAICRRFDKYEKEDDMENENTTTKIDTDAELRDLRAQVEELQEELEQAKEKNERQQSVIDGLNNELERKNGMVDGLKFAIRCNGVSGAEVR